MDFALPLGPDVPRGVWRVETYADPDAPALASETVLVEDFIPDRIDFDVTFDADGSVQGSQTKGVSVRLAQSDLPRLEAVFAQTPPELHPQVQSFGWSLGSAIGEHCIQEGLKAPEHIFAIPDRFITQGQHDELTAELGLRGEDIASEIAGRMAKTA